MIRALRKAGKAGFLTAPVQADEHAIVFNSRRERCNFLALD
jgi:hypothetical protein